VKRKLLFVTLVVVALSLVVAFRDALRNTVATSVNRGRPQVDRTGNRTNDIPARRGELPVDLQ
jgi:hypothetical protein